MSVCPLSTNSLLVAGSLWPPAKQEVCGSNPASYLCWNTHVGKVTGSYTWLYTPAEVSHQRWISGNVYHVCLRKVRIRQNPLWLWNPEETSQEVRNRGISGPKNGHVSNKNLKKKISVGGVGLSTEWGFTLYNLLKSPTVQLNLRVSKEDINVH